MARPNPLADLVHVAPVILSDSVALAAGATGILNLTRLQAPQLRPMLVREIVFSASIPTSVGDFGPIVQARLLAGRLTITDGFVPISNFGPTYDRFYNDSNALGLSGAQSAGVTTTYSVYRWVLPQPLYVGAGGGIHATFFRTAQFDSSFTAAVTSASITARCTVIGSIVKGPAPSEIDVPYAAAFVAATSGLRARKSLEDDLKNVTDKPVTTQRFVGTLLSTAGAPASTPSRIYNLSASNDFRVQIVDPHGNTLTSAPTTPDVNWESIFHPQHPAWTIRQVLEPGKRYSVTLSKTPTLQYPGVPMVSVIGSRKEHI